jgi:hypothetical protein
MRRASIGLGIAAAALAFSATDAAADVIKFQQGVAPTVGYIGSDAAMDSANPAVVATAANNVVIGRTTTPAIRRGVYGFDLSAIPDGATIDSVSFKLVATRTDSGANGSVNGQLNLNLVALTNPFNEAEVTWNNRTTANTWTTPGGDLGTTLSSHSDNPTTITNLTSFVFPTSASLVSAVQTVADANGTFSFAVKADNSVETTNTRNVFFFYSEEDGNAPSSARPELTVNYTVPEPGSLALIAMPLLGLLTRRSRQ